MAKVQIKFEKFSPWGEKKPQGFRLAVFLLDPPTPFRGRRRGKDL